MGVLRFGENPLHRQQRALGELLFEARRIQLLLRGAHFDDHRGLMHGGIGLGVGKLVLETGAAVVGGLQLQLIKTRELLGADAAGWQPRQDGRQFAGIKGVIEIGPALVVLVDHEQGIGKRQTVRRRHAGGGVVVEEVAIHQGDRIATGLG